MRAVSDESGFRRERFRKAVSEAGGCPPPSFSFDHRHRSSSSSWTRRGVVRYRFLALQTLLHQKQILTTSGRRLFGRLCQLQRCDECTANEIIPDSSEDQRRQLELFGKAATTSEKEARGQVEDAGDDPRTNATSSGLLGAQ